MNFYEQTFQPDDCLATWFTLTLYMPVRHVDYFNSLIPEDDETELGDPETSPVPIILSTWHEFLNGGVGESVNWNDPHFHVLTREHFYRRFQ